MPLPISGWIDLLEQPWFQPDSILSSPCAVVGRRGGPWASPRGSMLGTRNLHRPMVSMKTLAAESTNCGANNVPQSRCWFHPLPSSNTRFTKNFTAHLSETPDCRVGRRSEGTPSANDGKLVGSVLSLKGSLDSRSHSWAKSTPRKVGCSLPGQMFQVPWPEMQTESTWRGSAMIW